MAKKTTKKTARAKPVAKPAMSEMLKAPSNDKKSCCSPCWAQCGAWSMTFLRVVIGALFLVKGVQKLMIGPAIFGMKWFGYTLGAVEAIAGVLLIIGLWTFWGAKTVAVIMTGAIFLVHFKDGWANFPFLQMTLLAAALVLAHYGPGKLAIDNKCGCSSGCGC